MIRARYRIAAIVSVLPGQCGINVWRWYRRMTHRSVPWSRVKPGCRQDAERTGTCMCGNVTNPRRGAR